MAKSKVFMIMPFQDQFFEVYEMLKQKFEECFEFSNAAEEGNQQNILKDIIQPIYEADVIIADLTGLNPNVLYELGVAHTFNKKTIVITQDDLASLPFDLKQYRARDYTTHFKKFAELIEYMRENLDGAVSGNVVFSNPIKDFLKDNGVHDMSWFSEERIQIDIGDNENGFLDFLAGIEEESEKLVSGINSMMSDMDDMTSAISTSTREIERVSKTGGNGTASFAKKEARKVAEGVELFSKNLKEHNKQFSVLWNRIEKDSLGLLENEYASLAENRGDLVGFLQSLKKLQSSVFGSREAIENMKATFLKNIGIQRSLNQSIRFLDEDLKTFLEFMDFMSSSIDKILNKSRFIVGEIDFSTVAEEISQS